MRCFGATEELLTLTKQTRIDQCERVRVNWQTAKTATGVGLKGRTSKQPGATHKTGGWENRPTFHRVFLAKNKVVLEKLRATNQLQTLILVDKHKAWASGGIGLGNRWSACRDPHARSVNVSLEALPWRPKCMYRLAREIHQTRRV